MVKLWGKVGGFYGYMKSRLETSMFIKREEL